jgi:hypothetical protein
VSLRRLLLLALAWVVLLSAGAGVAFVLTDQLGIRTEAVDIPVENPVAAPERPSVPPLQLQVLVDETVPRLEVAASELAAALGDSLTDEPEATLELVGGGAGDDETYTLAGTPDALRVEAATDAGLARGLYDLAAQARAGRSMLEHLGETVTPRLAFRMADLGAVGVTPDESEWIAGDDYSHISGAFRDALLPEAPYVDEPAFAAAADTFEAFARHAAAQGFTAIAVPGLIEFLTFDAAGVYRDAPDRVAQAEAMRAAYRPMLAYAESLGLETYLRSDMLTLTTPLEQHLTDEFGLDATDPALWEVYTGAMDELYAALPQLDGVVIRIGEAGDVYDVPGFDYYSRLAVRNVDEVRAMLTALTAQAERSDTDVVFRTWTVGVGPVGDLHTDTDSYHAVLDGIDSPNLVVSTKYTLGDFYSHLPFNDTLEIGDHRRIVEFQSRREFEFFGAFPNDLGGLYRDALQTFLAANSNIEGVWIWTQDGGPWRAGPMSLELTSGFWQLAELNTELALGLARDPDADPAQLTADWAHRWLSDDPATVAAIGEVMALSREAITKGLYIGPYADEKVFAIGLEPPPMMWLFEWDIVTGDSAVLDVIYAISREELDAAIAEGDRAQYVVAEMLLRVTETEETAWMPGMREQFVAALEYEQSTLNVLALYRSYFLRLAEWHDTGSLEAYAAWTASLDLYREAAARHLETYTGDVQHPPLNLTAADLGITRAERDLPMAWAARVLLGLTVLWIALGIAGRHPRVRRVPGAVAASAMFTAATRPWRAVDAVRDLGIPERVLLIAVPAVALIASRGILTWFEAPAHALTMLAAWAVFAAVAVVAARRASIWPVIATLGGVALLRIVLLLAALAPTGPGGYWFGFWTDPTRRSLYVTIAFALLLWLVVAAAWTLAVQLGRRRATGVALAGTGAAIGGIAVFVGLVGAETALTVWNDQMGLLPWGLSRILGITTYLDIPADTPWYAAAFGAVLVVAGLLLALPRRRTGRA